jgi:hypothetical protein
MKKPYFLILKVLTLLWLTHTSIFALSRKQTNIDGISAIQQDTLTELEKFKNKAKEDIRKNEKELAELKIKLKGKSQEILEKNQQKINELEQKNNALKKKIENHSAQQKEKLEKFKKEFKKEMDEIIESLKSLKEEQK